MRKRVMYVVLRTGYRGDGPARIGWVAFSKTGNTAFYRDRELVRNPQGGIADNFVDVDRGEEYSIWSIRRLGRLSMADSQRVDVDDDARDEYEKITVRLARHSRSRSSRGYRP
jgi:hypothetical protein